MTTATLNPADVRMRDAVMLQLEWDSQIDATGIGVTAKNQAVTLTGFVGSYAEKLAAERVAKRVAGVHAVANDIQVRLRFERTDDEIAADAAHALVMRPLLRDTVQAVVRGGQLTLTGWVPTLFDKAVAEQAVRHVPGLKGILNHLEVHPAASAVDVKKQINRALHDEATTTGKGIIARVDGRTVTLIGHVRTLHEREAAERAAMHAHGIVAVDNRITVGWSIDD